MSAVVLSDGIRLLSGALFDYNAPRASEVLISDIAASLSKVCRFAGHIHQFYSVAQHAVNTRLIVAPEYAFTALMHDTAEAFTNDLPTPLKFAVPIFKELEVRIESAMAERFGFTYPLPDAVKFGGPSNAIT
jgi:5'-deoxynucleotidase YfbR-like HD superfamily hydrolase